MARLHIWEAFCLISKHKSEELGKVLFHVLPISVYKNLKRNSPTKHKKLSSYQTEAL